jgi:hypothetical protein
VEPGHELELLRERIAHLERLVGRLTGRDVAQDGAKGPEPAPGLDRRRMLWKGLGLSAVAVAGVGMLDTFASSAAAADGDAVTVGQTVSPTSASSDPTRFVNPSSTLHSTALLRCDNSTNVPTLMPANTRAAVVGCFSGDETPPVNGVGILGMSDSRYGVQGISTIGAGVFGSSDSSIGVIGQSVSGAGVWAGSTHGPGVDATSDNGRAVQAFSHSGEAVHGTSSTNIGVVGEGAFGVYGNGKTEDGQPGGTGVAATGDIGVHAEATGLAVKGVASDSDGVGVNGTCPSGIGVQAVSTDGVGLDAKGNFGVVAHGTSAGISAYSEGAAIGATSTNGTGVFAVSSSGTGVDASGSKGVVAHGDVTAVEAVSIRGTAVDATSATGTGLRATSTGGTGVTATSASGHGLVAASADGVGASFNGGSAAVRLVPRSTEGAPTTGDHLRGEIVVDHAGKLWACTKAGAPGNWKQIAFV